MPPPPSVTVGDGEEVATESFTVATTHPVQDRQHAHGLAARQRVMRVHVHRLDLDTLWKQYTPGWDLHQLRHTAISARAAQGYTEVELKRFSGHQSLRSLEVYIAHNREAAKRKAHAWERRDSTGQ